MQKYYTEVIQYTSNYNLISNCNSISFTNTGTVNAYVNKFELAPGATLAIAGNFGEIDVTEYKISFPNNAGQLSVIRKMYL